MHYRCGIDVGGTFTDAIGWESETGELRLAKVPTTRNQSEGFLEGARAVTGGDVADLRQVVHGTTAATNALLERRGSNVGILTTRGFRDLLELRRRDRPLPYGLRADYEPLVERRLRAGVEERTAKDGTVERPVNPDEVVEVARLLVEGGAESLAIVFLNAFANPSNESVARKTLSKSFPGVFATASTDLLQEIGEFERTVAASLNSYVGPVLERYLDDLKERMEARGSPAACGSCSPTGGAWG